MFCKVEKKWGILDSAKPVLPGEKLRGSLGKGLGKGEIEVLGPDSLRVGEERVEGQGWLIGKRFLNQTLLVHLDRPAAREFGALWRAYIEEGSLGNGFWDLAQGVLLLGQEQVGLRKRGQRTPGERLAGFLSLGIQERIPQGYWSRNGK